MTIRNRIGLACLVLTLVLNTNANAEFGDELFTLRPTLAGGTNGDRDPIDGQEFGGATAVSGDYAIVAAEEDAFNGISAGAVFLFDLTTGETVRALDPVGNGEEDGLGESVAMEGNIALITADGKNRDTGIGYLFDVTTGEELRSLTASDGMPGDELGQAAAISGDLILLGAEGADSGQGAAYVFRASTGEQLTRLSVGDPEEKEIGNEAALAGNHVLLGGDNPAVYLFDATTGEMRKKFTVEGAGNLGSSVAASGKWGLIGSDDEDDGAGAAYLVDMETAEIVHRFTARDAEPDDEFGDTVAIDGTTVLIGATSDNEDAGAVYVFDAITGMQLAKLAPEGLSMDDGLGASIGVSNGIAVFGADEDVTEGVASGLAYVFNVSTTDLADVNDDGLVNVADIDELNQALAAASTDAQFDLNHDGTVDSVDRSVWVEALQHTYLGDSNLDGQFDSSDLVVVFSVGEYEDTVDGNSGWADGDWNGDGDFNTSDLVAAFSAGGYDMGTRTAVAAVPEPSSFMLLIIGLVAGMATKRRAAF